MSYKFREEEVLDHIRLWNLFEINKALDMGVSAEKLVIKNQRDILLEAIIRKSKLLFIKILKNNFDFNCNGFLYLHHAIRGEKFFYIEELIEKMTNEELNKKDLMSQNNALHVACEANLQDVIVLLSKNNVDWNSKNKLKQTPLHILLRKSFYIEDDVLKEILDKKFSIEVKDIMGISCKDIIKSLSLDSEWKNIKENQTLLDKFGIK